MIFRQLKETPTKPSPSGSRVIKKYDMRMTKSGHKYVAEVDKINIYNKIQDKKSECDVIQIVRRAKMGDPAALARIQNVKTTYGDTTQAPQNLMQAQQMIIDGKRAFDELPTEIKQKFNNNPMEFMANEKKVGEVLKEYLKAKGAWKEEEKETKETQIKEEEEKL